MSDNDFFFDDEDAPAADTAKPSKGSPKASSKPAPGPKAAGSKSSGSGKQDSAKAVTSTTGDAPAAGQMFEKTVTLAVAALLAVIGLLLGVIIGIFVGQSMAGAPVATTPATGTGAAPSGSAAPLTEDQMSGGLPEGHPDIGSMGGTETETETAQP